MRRFLLVIPLFVALACDSGKPGDGKTGDGKTGTGTGDKKDTTPAKAKHPYASFKAGSFAEYHTVSETEVAGNKSKTEMDMKTTILDVTADKVTIETETK